MDGAGGDDAGDEAQGGGDEGVVDKVMGRSWASMRSSLVLMSSTLCSGGC